MSLLSVSDSLAVRSSSPSRGEIFSTVNGVPLFFVMLVIY